MPRTESHQKGTVGHRRQQPRVCHAKWITRGAGASCRIAAGAGVLSTWLGSPKEDSGAHKS
eukprot:2284476-Alexandrium_andersonii.AAC.1